MTLKTRTGNIAALTPNWRDAVQIEYEFKTSILDRFDGTEQREAMRSSPRIRIDYTAMLRADRMARFMADANKDMDAVVSVPIPGHVETISSLVTTTITLAATPFWAVAGARAIIYSDTAEETVDIASVTATTIVLTSEPNGSFTAGDKIVHAKLGRFESGTQFEAMTNSVWEGPVTYALDPAQDPMEARPISPATFESSSIFGWSPNWRASPQITFTDQRDNLDHGRGIIAGYNPVAFPTQEQSMTFLGRTAQEAEEILAFFLSVYGRQIGFWMPTFMDDVYVDEMEGDNILVVGQDAYDAYNGSRVYNVLHFNGQLNRISAVEAAGGGRTRFVMTDPWVEAPEAGDYLSWAPMWRMSSDKLIVEWQTNSVAEMKIAMQTIPNEAP